MSSSSAKPTGGLSRAVLKRKKHKEKQQQQIVGGLSATVKNHKLNSKSKRHNFDEDDEYDDEYDDDGNTGILNTRGRGRSEDDDDGDDDYDDDENSKRSKVSKKAKINVPTPSQSQVKEAKRPSSEVGVNSIGSKINISYKFDKASILGKTIVEVLNASSSDNSRNSFVETSNKTLALLLWPHEIDSFFFDFWGKSPVVCQNRNNSKISHINSSISSISSSGITSKSMNICKGLFSAKKLEKILDTQILLFNSDINVVRFIDSSQESVVDGLLDAESEDSEVEASAAIIRQKFAEGYSVEFNSIAKFDDMVWSMLSHLEHILESSVEPQVIWTPSGAGLQGRGPRVLQGDMMFLQLEGARRISMYAPVNGVHVDNDLSRDKPLPDVPYMDIDAKGGDFIYVPRGWIIVQKSLPDIHSLGLDMSFNLTNTYHGLMELVLPQALEAASRGTPAIRGALPRNWMSFMGVANSEADEEDKRGRLEDEDARREAFKGQLRKNLMVVVNSVLDSCDAAMDQMAKSYIGSRLPMPLTDAEEARSVIKAKDVVIQSYTKLRVLRPNIARAVIEDGVVVVYHCQDNARVVFGAPLNPLEFELDDGPAIEVLLNAYPEGVSVLDLPHPSDELDDKIGVADALFKEGILVIEDDTTAINGGDGEGNGEDDDDDDCPF